MIFRTAKRALGIALVAVLVALTATAAQAQPDLPPGGTFVDDDGNIHEGNIEAIAAARITFGCNPPANDRYCPRDSVTRGAMAAFLKRALDLAPTNTDHFVDDDDSIFERDINALAEARITLGCNPPANDEFCPNDPVTRGAMAAFLVRGLGYTDDGGGDLFIDDDDSVFERDIDRLGTARVTRGCNPPANDRFCPREVVTRAQMASFVARALELSPRNPPPVMAVAPYFYLDENGHPGRRGPFVAPIHRRVPATSGTAGASLRALLAGPTTGEEQSIPSITTRIGDGTELNSVTIDNGLAIVDLSGEFGAGSAPARAAAQIVFTLTRFNSVSRVLFRIDGVPVPAVTDNGGVVSRAVNRNDYLDFQAAVSVEEPTYGGSSADSVRVTGMAAVFEATFEYALVDRNGLIIAEGFATSSSGVGWGSFDFTIDYDVNRSQMGALIVWVNSAADGSQIDIREYPVYLQP